MHDIILPPKKDCYFHATLHNSKHFENNNKMYSEKWYPYHKNNNSGLLSYYDKKQNSLRIFGGMIGCTKNYLTYPKKYLSEKNVKIEFTLDNQFRMVKICHLNEKFKLTKLGKIFNNEYALDRQFYHLSTNNYNIVAETVKAVTKIKNNISKLHLCSCDGINNIQILCDSNILKIKNITYIGMPNTLNMKKNEIGYHIPELCGTKCLNILGNMSQHINKCIWIEFEPNHKLNKIDFIYDRFVYNTSLRKHVATNVSGEKIIDINTIQI